MEKNKDKEWPWPSQPMNWIEGMHMEMNRKKHLHPDDNFKDTILRVFVYLIFIPSMSVLMWYGLYKLVMWIFS